METNTVFDADFTAAAKNVAEILRNADPNDSVVLFIDPNYGIPTAMTLKNNPSIQNNLVYWFGERKLYSYRQVSFVMRNASLKEMGEPEFTSYTDFIYHEAGISKTDKDEIDGN